MIQVCISSQYIADDNQLCRQVLPILALCRIRQKEDREDPCWLIPHPVLYHPSVTILIRGDRYFSRWTHIKSCKVWNGENNFVPGQDISSTQVLCVEISTNLHINTLYYTYHLIHSSSLTMQLKVKLEMHLNAGMNASLLLIVDIELIF